MLKLNPARLVVLGLTAFHLSCAGTDPAEGETPEPSGGQTSTGGALPHDPGDMTGGAGPDEGGTGGLGLGGDGPVDDGSGGDDTTGNTSGGAGTGGTGSGGDDGAGGANTGGDNGSGGDDGSGGSGVGGSGSGGSDGSGGAAPVALRMDYFHDGAVIRAIDENGGIQGIAPLLGPAPRAMVFREADVESTGLFSRRRQSALLHINGGFHRLEGEVPGDEEPALVQVTALNNAITLCDWLPISPPTDRPASHLLLTYSTGGSCAAGLQHTRIPLLGDADSPQLHWDGMTRQLRDSYGYLDGYLRLHNGFLEAVVSYEDPSPLKQLLPLTYVSSYYLHPLDDGTYFLMVMKASTLWDLYHYDTNDHSLLGPLAQNFVSFSGPGGHRNQSRDAYFFPATVGSTTKIYRLLKDGSNNIESLEGYTGNLRVLGVVDDDLFFAVGNSSAVTYRISVDADFSVASQATVVLGDANVAPHFISEDRLFYTRHINSVDKRIGVIKLDGTEQEEVPTVSLAWIGCDNDADFDFPNSVDTGLCSRVYAAGYFYSGAVRSYSAHSGGSGFFSDAARDPVEHGSLTPSPASYSSALTNRTGAGTVGQDFVSAQTAGTLFGINPPGSTYYKGIFVIPPSSDDEPTLTKFWTNGVDTVWLN
jgi:hypothetical protein